MSKMTHSGPALVGQCHDHAHMHILVCTDIQNVHVPVTGNTN